MGSCVAGGATYLCDEAIIVEGTGSIFLASYLVKAAIGEVLTMKL
jgi:acetyl-CoA carboxylase carboxyltransferase component